MEKFRKISIIFLAIFLLILFYIIITTERVDNESIKQIEYQTNPEDEVAVTPEKSSDDINIENNYKDEIVKYFSDYKELTKKDNFSPENLLKIENEVLALKVPTQYKNLHINFILSISKMKQYLSDNNEDKKQESENFIKEIELNYPWINK